MRFHALPLALCLSLANGVTGFNTQDQAQHNMEAPVRRNGAGKVLDKKRPNIVLIVADDLGVSQVRKGHVEKAECNATVCVLKHLIPRQ